MGELSPWHWAIVIIVLVVLFGARRLPDAARSLGRSARILKSELRAVDQESPAQEPTTASGAAQPASDVSMAEADPTITRSQSPPRQN